MVISHLRPQVQEQLQPARSGQRLQQLPEVLRKRRRRSLDEVDALGGSQSEDSFELLRPEHVAGGRGKMHRGPAALADRPRRRCGHPFSRRGSEQRDQEPGAITQPVGLLQAQDPQGGEDGVASIAARPGQARGAEARTKIDSCAGRDGATRLDQAG